MGLNVRLLTTVSCSICLRLFEDHHHYTLRLMNDNDADEDDDDDENVACLWGAVMGWQVSLTGAPICSVLNACHVSSARAAALVMGRRRGQSVSFHWSTKWRHVSGGGREGTWWRKSERVGFIFLNFFLKYFLGNIIFMIICVIMKCFITDYLLVKTGK